MLESQVSQGPVACVLSLLITHLPEEARDNGQAGHRRDLCLLGLVLGRSGCEHTHITGISAHFSPVCHSVIKFVIYFAIHRFVCLL